jgi:hypothetical protein
MAGVPWSTWGRDGAGKAMTARIAGVSLSSQAADGNDRYESYDEIQAMIPPRIQLEVAIPPDQPSGTAQITVVAAWATATVRTPTRVRRLAVMYPAHPQPCGNLQRVEYAERREVARVVDGVAVGVRTVHARGHRRVG